LSTVNEGRRGYRGALFLLLFPFLVACGARPEPVSAPDLPSRAAVEGVPLIEQEAFYCGPAALAMAMQWGGLDVSQDAIAAQSFTPGAEGTYLADMVGAARRQGRLAVPVAGMHGLMAEVAAGHPVIVFQNLGVRIAPLWHYAVVVAYDLPADRVILHSGQHERMELPVALFQRTWARGENWAIVVLPPGQLPVSADPWEVASAAAALERVGETRAAAATYAAAETRWPDLWVFPFGRGNTAYGLGDKKGAKAAWLRAKRLGPEVAEIRQNLAELAREGV